MCSTRKTNKAAAIAEVEVKAAVTETVIIYDHFTGSCLVNNLFYYHL